MYQAVPFLDISINGCRILTLAGKSGQKIVKEVVALKVCLLKKGPIFAIFGRTVGDFTKKTFKNAKKF